MAAIGIVGDPYPTREYAINAVAAEIAVEGSKAHEKSKKKED
jgi:hypothetical protein